MEGRGWYSNLLAEIMTYEEWSGQPKGVATGTDGVKSRSGFLDLKFYTVMPGL